MLQSIVVILVAFSMVVKGDNPLVNNHRPVPQDRKFVSPIIEQTLNEIVPKMLDEELALLFVDSFPNTLDTTVFYDPGTQNRAAANDADTTKAASYNGPDTFIITGDIDAMWLRDSSGQVYPYVQFANQDPHLKDMLKGLIHRQVYYINQDSYANAFNKDPSGSPWDSDHRIPSMSPILWEGKYEIDSLAWVLKLIAHYYETTQDSSICTTDWFSALQKILETFTYQQQQLDTMSKEDKLFYSFERQTYIQSETLQDGVGLPSRRCGLIRGGFRPSDDAHRFPFQIPGNAFASVGLAQVGQILLSSSSTGCNNITLGKQFLSLSEEIKAGIAQEGVVTIYPKLYGEVYAYEVDGYSSRLMMDDANVPSLLSLPYLGFLQNTDPVYQNTRKNLLSEDNPFYICGKAGCGIGSPHTGLDNIWPLSCIVQALTSTNDDEIKYCLDLLRDTTAGTYFIHESFNKDNTTNFTRSWFAWANSMFGMR